MKNYLLFLLLVLGVTNVFAIKELPKAGEFKQLTTKWSAKTNLTEIVIDGKIYVETTENAAEMFSIWHDDSKLIRYHAKNGDVEVLCEGRGEGCYQANKNAIRYIKAWGEVHL